MCNLGEVIELEALEKGKKKEHKKKELEVLKIL